MNKVTDDLISRAEAKDYREKIIKGLERCLKHTCPAVGSKEYLECEYTIGLYCRQDILLRDILVLLKAQKPVVHGLWIDTGSGQECSVCGEIQYGYDSGRFYCANCGAKMETKNE